jgi:hypothetical protein
MSYSVITGGDKWTAAATINGWRELRDWSESLDGEFGELSHFIEYGWSQDMPLLKSQANEAIKSGNPAGDVKDILATVIHAINSRQSGAQSILLTDGLTTKDDQSGWQSNEEEPDDGKED